jgi:Caspase domain
MNYFDGQALVIGVGSYILAPEQDIRFTSQNAKAVAATLCDPQYCGYQPSRVELLVDETATQDNVLAAFDRLIVSLRPTDTLLIYYCGFGSYAIKNYFLTTSDSQVVGNTVKNEIGIRDIDLLEKLQRIRANQVFFIVDACHISLDNMIASDMLIEHSGAGLPFSLSSALLSTGAGRVVLTSCRESQSAFHKADSFSIFTEALINSLTSQGGQRSNRSIDILDVFGSIYLSVEDMTSQQNALLQNHKYIVMQEPELTLLQETIPFTIAVGSNSGEIGISTTPKSYVYTKSIHRVAPNISAAISKQYQQVFAQASHIHTEEAQKPIQDSEHSKKLFQKHSSIIDFGTGNQFGNIKIDNVAAGDIIRTGDFIGSTGIAVGRQAQSEVAQSQQSAQQQLISGSSELQQLAEQLLLILKSQEGVGNNSGKELSKLVAQIMSCLEHQKPNKQLLHPYINKLEQTAALLNAPPNAIAALCQQFIQVARQLTEQQL